MKKYLLLLLSLFLTLACFADNSDRSDLYTIRETIEIALPKEGTRDYLGDDWFLYREGFEGANLFIKAYDRDSYNIENNDSDNPFNRIYSFLDEDVTIRSHHLFGSDTLEVNDLLPIYLQGKNGAEWDVTLVEELEDGLILLNFETYESSRHPGTETDPIKFLHLVRLILSDRAYHIIDYERGEWKNGVEWSDEDQELWIKCLHNAQIVPIG